LQIHLYNGNEPSSFEYYEDDGVSYDYTSGKSYKRLITFHPEVKKLHFTKAHGPYVTHFRNIRLYFHGFDVLKAPIVNSKGKDISFEDYQFIPPVSSFDPFYKVDITDMVNNNLPFIEFENITDEINIHW
jgi:alpha-glucosidase